jgi:hypothetical protein
MSSLPARRWAGTAPTARRRTVLRRGPRPGSSEVTPWALGAPGGVLGSWSTDLSEGSTPVMPRVRPGRERLLAHLPCSPSQTCQPSQGYRLRSALSRTAASSGCRAAAHHAGAVGRPGDRAVVRGRDRLHRHRHHPPPPHPALEREGGHVGYHVVPGHRRRGHATQMLGQAKPV